MGILIGVNPLDLEFELVVNMDMSSIMVVAIGAACLARGQKGGFWDVEVSFQLHGAWAWCMARCQAIEE